jgi:glycosyltransferase involved in cell wall biosynthesis
MSTARTTPTFVSVVIPVRNNASGLFLCLSALKNQVYPVKDFEVLVIDNDSTESLSSVKTTFPSVRWLTDSGPGSFSARNWGLKHARGEIVAFTDSDCIPTPTWLRNGVAALELNKCTIVGGNVDMIDPEDRGLSVYEHLEIVASGLPDSRRLVEERGFTTTGNFLTWRYLFDRVGLFDATLKSGGDREWVQRAVSHGENLVYCDDVVVRHPRRSSFRDLARKYRRQVGGRMVILKRKNPPFSAIVSDLLLHSTLSIQTYKIAFFYPHVHGLWNRIHFALAVLLMSIITSFERFKVWIGGEPSRG